MAAGNHGSCFQLGLDICFDEYNDHDPPCRYVLHVCLSFLISGTSKNFYEWKEFANQICNYFDKFYICSLSHINHRDNKEKDTTDHEGSEEITQEQQYSQSYVYHLFLSQFSSDFFLVCYIAILQP